MLTYNGTLPDPKRGVKKHWGILKINRDFEQELTELPIIATRRNKDIDQYSYLTPRNLQVKQSVLYKISIPSKVQSNT